MITDWFLQLLETVLGPLIEALPRDDLPEGIANGAGMVGGWVKQFDYFVPIREPFQFMLSALALTLPAFLAYRVGLWLYVRVRG